MKHVEMFTFRNERKCVELGRIRSQHNKILTLPFEVRLPINFDLSCLPYDNRERQHNVFKALACLPALNFESRCQFNWLVEQRAHIRRGPCSLNFRHSSPPSEWGIGVCIATGCLLDGRGTTAQFPAGAWNCIFLKGGGIHVRFPWWTAWMDGWILFR
jgi:hypothetical protein